MEQIWKPIKGYEGTYEISNLGKVKSLKRKTPGTFTTVDKEIKASKRGSYLSVRLSKNGKSKHFSLHRLLAIHFIENNELKKCVNHKNGNRLDNRLDNLEWCTYSENSIHGFRSNKRKNTNRKLTEQQVLEIKKEMLNYKLGMGRRLAKKYNVSVYIISLIKTNKTYLPENLG